MLVSEEWLEGKDARRDGLSKDDNPYPPGTRDSNDWNRGWNTGSDKEQTDENHHV